MASIKSLARRILSKGGYILELVASSDWKVPWQEAVKKGRIAINASKHIEEQYVEVHNILSTKKSFLDYLFYSSFGDRKIIGKTPGSGSYVFVFPIVEKTTKEFIVPEKTEIVSSWLFFSKEVSVPEEKVDLPWYRERMLNEILADGKNSSAIGAKISLPAENGEKARKTGVCDTRTGLANHMMFIGDQRLIFDIADCNYQELIMLYNELFSHWIGYSDCLKQGRLSKQVITQDSLKKTYEKAYNAKKSELS